MAGKQREIQTEEKNIYVEIYVIDKQYVRKNIFWMLFKLKPLRPKQSNNDESKHVKAFMKAFRW